MDLREFECAVRHINERYDGEVYAIDGQRMRQVLTQAEAKDELEYARRDNWWALRVAVNDYLYSNPTAFVYYGVTKDDESN